MNLRLKNLENRIKKAEGRPGFETITVIVHGVKEKGQDENKFYTIDGELYTGEGESGHVIRITRRCENSSHKIKKKKVKTYELEAIK